MPEVRGAGFDRSPTISLESGSLDRASGPLAALSGLALGRIVLVVGRFGAGPSRRFLFVFRTVSVGFLIGFRVCALVGGVL
jgi:hypothetical protein